MRTNGKSGALIVFLAALVIGVAACTSAPGSPSSASSGSSASTGQAWLITFNDSGSAPHTQTVRVWINPYTVGSTWGEMAGSAGLYMYSPDATCRYQMLVGGNSAHDSPYDRFSCVNLGASGCGMQTLGRCEFTVNGHFPDITSGSGTYTLTTQSKLGTVTGTNTITARRE